MKVLRNHVIVWLCFLLVITGISTSSQVLASSHNKGLTDSAGQASLPITAPEGHLSIDQQRAESTEINQPSQTAESTAELVGFGTESSTESTKLASEPIDEAEFTAQSADLSDTFIKEHWNGDWIVKWNTTARDPAFVERSIIVHDDVELNISVARPADGIEDHAWLSQWKDSPFIQYIEPNQKVTLLAAPNDELYRFQRNLNLIGAELAWDHIQSNTEITIAFVDTGVDLEHPDLQGNLVNGVNLIDSRASVQDDHGHGTNVAGVLAASGNNSLGIAGLLWKSKLMPIKALGSDGSGDEVTLGRGIRYAVDHGAKIVVLSLGLYKYSNFMQEVVDYAESKGVLLVAASGNDGKDIKYPAAYPSVLAVGGIRLDKTIEPKSNYGPELDVVAPWMVFTTALNGGYDYNEGTSMAAPQVAAVAAMIWAQQPNLKPYQVRNQIRQSAEDIGRPGWDIQTGYGLLRADRALTLEYKEDIYKPNQTRNQAKPLSIDKMIAASIEGGRDASWFALTAPYDGSVTLHFDSDNEQDLSLLEIWYYQPGTSPIRFTDIRKPVEVNVNKGTNHIHIQTKDRNVNKTINFRLTTRFLIYRDAFASNHRQYLAYVLPKGIRSVTGTFHQLNEQDWYVYQVEKPGTLQFSVSTDTNRMDLAMLVQREGEKATIYDIWGEGETEYSAIYDVFPGKYYIRITNESISKESHPVAGEYVLFIDYKEKLIDPNEPNNRSYQATAISLDTPYNGLIDPADDIDWYSFRLEQQSYVTIQVANIPTDRVITATLTDSNQKQIAILSNRLGSSNFVINQLLPKGIHYVKITANRPFQNAMYQITTKAEAITDGYRDIADSWAREFIVDLTQRDIVGGYPDYTFRPKLNVTRAEAAEMIVKALKLNETARLNFKDLQRTHWAYNSIAKAVQAGIVTGYPDGTFRPNQSISRAEMATMLARAMKWRGTAGAVAPFQDVDSDHWAAIYIRELKGKGWLTGYLDGTFRPNRPATREEYASLIYKMVH